MARERKVEKSPGSRSNVAVALLKGTVFLLLRYPIIMVFRKELRGQ
jgi:hypothetical protein